MSEHYEVVVVGSGAGGGIVAGELADHGPRSADPLRRAGDRGGRSEQRADRPSPRLPSGASGRGLFDEIQDAHMVYPITSHCMKFQRDENGGFTVEAATVQDPIGFATALCNEHGVPLWGEPLVEMLRKYRYFTGLLTMVNDENHGTAWVDEDGRDRYSVA